MSSDIMSSPPARTGLGSQFWRLAFSAGASNLADGVFKFALPLVALTFTRSPALVAGLELVRSLPWLLFALPVGALADRMDRRRTMLFANLLRTGLAGILAVVLGTGDGSIMALYVVAFGSGIAEVFYDTSSQSILPSLVERHQLGRANGRLGAIELGAQQFAGPPLAGLLVGAALTAAFWSTTALWVLAVAALWALSGNFRPEPKTEPTTIRTEVVEGVRFLMARPMLRTMATMVGVTNLASSAAGAVFVLYAVGPESTLRLSAAQFGLIILTPAAGALAASLVNERIELRLGRARTLTVAVLGIIVFIAAPAITTNVWLIVIAMLIGGATMMLWNIITVSFRQAVTPDHLLGRVNSVYRLLAWGTMPLGAAIGGIIAETLGLRAVYATMGLFAATLLIANHRITNTKLERAEEEQTTLEATR